MYQQTSYGSGRAYGSFQSPAMYASAEASAARYVDASPAPRGPQTMYHNAGSTYSGAAYNSNAAHSAESPVVFDPTQFLNPNAPHACFVGCTEEVKAIVEETCQQLLGTEFPKDVVLIVGSSMELARHYPGAWDPSIAGFALNRVGKGVSEIFVKADTMDRVMLTIGHELGHVQSTPLPSIIDEEAKAYAFSLAWIETIKKYNIGGLSPSVLLAPARNGIHDVALDFVLSVIDTITTPLRLFEQLAVGIRSAHRNTIVE